MEKNSRFTGTALSLYISLVWIYKLSWHVVDWRRGLSEVSFAPAVQIRHPRTRRWWLIRLLLLSWSSADGRLAGACLCYLWPGSGSVSDLSETSWWQLAFNRLWAFSPPRDRSYHHWFPFPPSTEMKEYSREKWMVWGKVRSVFQV